VNQEINPTPSCCESTSNPGWTTERVVAIIVLFLLCCILVWKAYSPEDVYLSDIKYETLAIAEGYDPVSDQNQNGTSIQIKTTTYPKGISTKAHTIISCRFIPDGYAFFVTEVGINPSPEAFEASVIFRILADGALLYESPVMKEGMDPRLVRVPIRGRHELILEAQDAGDGNAGDYANWAMSRFEYR
jgi:hypothetical protein